MIRYLLPAVAVLLAVALVVFGTHELCAHVLPFDWTSVAVDVPPAPVDVALPR